MIRFRQLFQLPTTIRTFTTTRTIMGKQEWLCILPDCPGALEARMKIRQKHLENVKPKVDTGLVVLGGATLDEPIKEGQPLKINGSALLVEADTEEEVRKLIEGDVYYDSKVWDAEKVQIFPFKTAVKRL